MNIKNEIIKLIDKEISGNPFESLGSFALLILKQKMLDSTISLEERQLLINDFLSNYLEFDSETDEPTGNSLIIEEMIDFILSEDCIAKKE